MSMLKSSLRGFHIPLTLAALIVAAALGVGNVCQGQVPAAEKGFDQEVGAFTRLLELPGLVVVVAKDGKVIHQVEWGHADVEAKRPVNINDLFLLASVTKTFTATMIMQMADERLLGLDDPMVDYWLPSFFPTRITPEYRIRHVLGHTAQGTPGRTFVYNGGRYGFAYGVFQKVGGLPLKESVIQRILTPLKMDSTMPGTGEARYKHLRERLAMPYRYDPGKRRHIAAPGELTMGELYASSGMAGSAIDLVRYAHALDSNEILSAQAHAAMTQPAVSTDGHALPYGIGWFVQQHGDDQLIWHYGYGGADSALLVRVPQQKLTLIALANSDQMSACSLLGDGDVLTSPIAVSFVKHFVSPQNAPHVPVDFDVAMAALEPRLDEMHQSGATPIFEDEVFTQALIRDYLKRRDGRNDSKASDLLRWLLRKAPKRLNRPDLATLTLLSRQTDPELLAAVRPVLKLLLTRQPENPGVLAAAVQYHERMGQDRSAVDARRLLANLKGYEDDPRKQEAAVRLGKDLSDVDPDLARTYLWNAMTWWFNSGGGGDLGREINDTIDKMRRRQKEDPQKAAGRGM